MIRFRFIEDEKRYLTLVGEIYRLVATHLPPAAANHAMRNLGKAQDMLMLEGVRQGVAVAEISRLRMWREGATNVNQDLKAFQVHAAVYGSSDTPLRDVELEWLSKLGIEPSTSEHAWLDGKPMRFAPQSLEEWQADLARSPDAASTSEAMTCSVCGKIFEGNPARAMGVAHGPPVVSCSGCVGKQVVWSDDERLPPPVAGSNQEDTQERPALLDQARDALQQLVKGGYEPTSWPEMIMRLHLLLRIDAGFLDLQMSTEMGRTVLAQCGIFNIEPGRGLDLGELRQMLDDPPNFQGSRRPLTLRTSAAPPEHQNGDGS